MYFCVMKKHKNRLNFFYLFPRILIEVFEMIFFYYVGDGFVLIFPTFFGEFYIILHGLNFVINYGT